MTGRRHESEASVAAGASVAAVDGCAGAEAPHVPSLLAVLLGSALLGSAVLLGCGGSGRDDAGSAGSAAAVYQQVAESIPWIETLTGVSSGVLIEGGYVVTSYHAVWPLDYARVVFPGGPGSPGAELLEVPVVGWDPVHDLAVLGPVETSAPALEWQDDEVLPQGSELFLVGYPALVEPVLESSITQGILIRRRDWGPSGLTHLLSDARVVGGQNGGVLVDARARIVGIVTRTASRAADEADLTIANAASDAAATVRRLIEQSDRGDVGVVERLGYRSVARGAADRRHEVLLDNVWDYAAFVFESSKGSKIDFAIAGEEDGLFTVFDASGAFVEADESLSGLESGTVEIARSGMHFLLVGMRSAGAAAAGRAMPFEVESTVEITPLADPDDGRAIGMAEALPGAIDHANDLDWYAVGLQEGAVVRVVADSAGADPALCAAFLGGGAAGSGAAGSPSGPDSGGGSGAAGLPVCDSGDSGGRSGGAAYSELVFRAAETGEYLLAVTSSQAGAFGGYYLTVDAAPEGVEAVDVPAPDVPAPDDPGGAADAPDDPGSPVSADFEGWDLSGEMQTLRDADGYLELQLPSSWTASDPEALSDGTIIEASDDAAGSVLEASRFDSLEAVSGIIDMGSELDVSIEFSTLSDLVSLIVAQWRSAFGDDSVLRSEPVETAAADPAHRLELHTGTEVVLLVFLTGLDGAILALVHVFPSEIWQDGLALADHTFSTMLFDGEPFLAP